MVLLIGTSIAPFCSPPPRTLKQRNTTHTLRLARLSLGGPIPPDVPKKVPLPDGTFVMHNPRYYNIQPEWWDEYEDERDKLLLVLVLIDRRGAGRSNLLELL